MLFSINIESHAVTITTFSKDRIQFRLNHNGSTQTNYKNVEEKVYFTQSPEEVVIKVLG